MKNITKILTNRDFLAGLAIGVVGVIAYSKFIKPKMDAKKIASTSV